MIGVRKFALLLLRFKPNRKNITVLSVIVINGIPEILYPGKWVGDFLLLFFSSFGNLLF